MKSNQFLFALIFSFIGCFCFAQIKTSKLKDGVLSKADYQKFKDYLVAKNLPIKDTIFIKYDFNGERCWEMLDNMSNEHVENVLYNFQEHIKQFNILFPSALAVNFREPGKRINKLKLWDDTIVIDDQLILKQLFFKNRALCGTSAVVLGDGSYLIYKGDPHFELLQLHHNYNGKKF